MASKLAVIDRVQAFQEAVTSCLERLLSLTHERGTANPFNSFEDFVDLSQAIVASNLPADLKDQIPRSLGVISKSFEHYIHKLDGGSIANNWDQWKIGLADKNATDLREAFPSEFENVGEFMTPGSLEIGTLTLKRGSRLSVQALVDSELQAILKDEYDVFPDVQKKLPIPFSDFEADRRIELGVDEETCPLLARYEKVRIKSPTHDDIVACIVGCKAALIRRYIKAKFDSELWKQAWNTLNTAVGMANADLVDTTNLAAGSNGAEHPDDPPERPNGERVGKSNAHWKQWKEWEVYVYNEVGGVDVSAKKCWNQSKEDLVRLGVTSLEEFKAIHTRERQNAADRKRRKKNTQQ